MTWYDIFLISLDVCLTLVCAHELVVWWRDR